MSLLISIDVSKAVCGLFFSEPREDTNMLNKTYKGLVQRGGEE